MLLLSRNFLPYLLNRIAGVDGHYTAFRLAFYHGTDPRNAAGPPGSNVLAQFDFPSPWATPRDGTHIYKTGPISTTITASGAASYWRLLGLNGGTWSTVVHGSIGLVGSDADIKVSTLEWVLGDPLALKGITIFPLKLTY